MMICPRCGHPMSPPRVALSRVYPGTSICPPCGRRELDGRAWPLFSAEKLHAQIDGLMDEINDLNEQLDEEAKARFKLKCQVESVLGERRKLLREIDFLRTSLASALKMSHDYYEAMLDVRRMSIMGGLTQWDEAAIDRVRNPLQTLNNILMYGYVLVERQQLERKEDDDAQTTQVE